MCTVHGLYCYEQNEYHTNSWMKIILFYGMMTIPFLGDSPWYDIHTMFGMPSVKSEIIPILV